MGVALSDVGVTVTITEASRLVEQIIVDPGSHLGAEIRGWDYPASREHLALLDLYDLLHVANSDPKKPRPKPYPRPWPAVEKRVAKPGLSQEDVLAALRRAGHTNLPG